MDGWVILCFFNTVFLFVTYSYDEAMGSMDTGYPRSIEDDFPGMDDEIDAAAYHHGIKAQISLYSNRVINGTFLQHHLFVFLTCYPNLISFRLLVFLPWTHSVWVQLYLQKGHPHPAGQLHPQLLIINASCMAPVYFWRKKKNMFIFCAGHFCVIGFVRLRMLVYSLEMTFPKLLIFILCF